MNSNKNIYESEVVCLKKKREPHRIDEAKIKENAAALFDREKASSVSTFAIVFNDLLEKRGVHQEEIASALGVSVGAISKYRNGKAEPGLTNLVAIANYLGVDCHYLMTGVSSENRAIYDRTGLSDKAVSELETFFEVSSRYKDQEMTFSKVINNLFETSQIEILAAYLIGVWRTNKETLAFLKEIDNTGIKTDDDLQKLLDYKDGLDYSFYKVSSRIRKMADALFSVDETLEKCDRIHNEYLKVISKL